MIKKFNLGVCASTPAAQDLLTSYNKTAQEFILRHAACDWGDVGCDDAHANDMSVKSGDQILSVYHLAPGKSVWVITEGNRVATTVLLPEDY